ncbi:MAG: hypothetical protein ACI4O7_11760 [Aristaeellaceae bacterium]
MADSSSSIQREVNQTRESVQTLQYTKISAAPDDLRTLVAELDTVRDTFRAASRMSNVGSDAFITALDDVTHKLKSAARLLDEIRL